MFDEQFSQNDDTKLKVKHYNGKIDLIKESFREAEFLGVPVLYNPLSDYEIHKELFCTHEVQDLLKLTEKTEKIVIIDIITNIEYRTSKRGNKYAKLHLMNLTGTYVYLWGEYYRKYISNTFKNQIHILFIDYNTATEKFNQDSFVCNGLKHISQVDVDEEIERLLRITPIEELDEEWMIKNRKHDDS